MKRVASLNLIASDCSVFLSISSHAARHAIHAFVGPDSSERALFRDWKSALLREEVANIGGMRCADGSMDGQKRPSSSQRGR